MKLYRHPVPEIYATNILTHEEVLEQIKCAISTKKLSQNLVRCKSSNVWGYAMDVREAGNNIGDVIVQFKAPKGGAGDCYIFYDVPIRVYRGLVGAPSKGHFFWVNIRNKYQYDKLGDKSWHGKLPNAVR